MFAIKSMVRAYVFCLSRKITLIESIFNEKELHVLNELIFQRDTIAYVKLLTGVQETYKYVILRYISSRCMVIISTYFFFEMALSAASVCCGASVIYLIKKSGFEFSFVVLLVHVLNQFNV